MNPVPNVPSSAPIDPGQAVREAQELLQAELQKVRAEVRMLAPAQIPKHASHDLHFLITSVPITSTPVLIGTCNGTLLIPFLPFLCF